MSDRWYYTHDENKIGPLSSRQLRDLADAGGVLPTDTIWKEGVEKGVAAHKVKNLFAATPTVESVAAVPSDETPPVESTTATALMEEAKPAPQEEAFTPSPKPAPPPYVKTGRAVAGRGVVIVGQDGTNVKIRKKCTECGHEDACWNTVRIRSGINKVAFFCPKCRRRREGQFQGTVR